MRVIHLKRPILLWPLLPKPLTWKIWWKGSICGIYFIHPSGNDPIKCKQTLPFKAVNADFYWMLVTNLPIGSGPRCLALFLEALVKANEEIKTFSAVLMSCSVHDKKEARLLDYNIWCRPHTKLIKGQYRQYRNNTNTFFLMKVNALSNCYIWMNFHNLKVFLKFPFLYLPTSFSAFQAQVFIKSCLMFAFHSVFFSARNEVAVISWDRVKKTLYSILIRKLCSCLNIVINTNAISR